MIKSGVRALTRELLSYTYYEKIFICLVMLCSFCITSEFSVAKPVSYSVFLSHFPSGYLPLAWLALLPLNFFVVALYNKLLPRLGCFNTACGTIILTITLNLLGVFFLKNHPWFSFFHFVWKDIYVLLMFQHLWSVVHATIEKHKAKYLYGIIYGIGGLGSVCGSCLPGFFALKYGSETLLYSTAVIYAFFIAFYFWMLQARKHMEQERPLQAIQIKESKGSGGFELIKNSFPLKFILCIVVLMQLGSTLVDFYFTTHLQQLFPIKDLRTEYTGKLFGVIHSVNMLLQFFGAFFLLEIVGLRKAHLLIPALFTIYAAGLVCVPSFYLVVAAFSTIKACDYSLFTILKEMLYLPLSSDEKFKAKAVIDVFAYRSSKALASIALLTAQYFTFAAFDKIVSWSLFFTFFLWIATVMYFTKKISKQDALNQN
jgi:AAA family ATP:ADP antiporter